MFLSDPNFWIGFVSGIVTNILAVYPISLISDKKNIQQNCKQWMQIKCVLRNSGIIDPMLGGVSSLIGGINDTPWVIRAQAIVSQPLSEDSGMEFWLGEREWHPNCGVVWEMSADVRKALKSPGSKVLIDVTYEPIHRNTGTVEGLKIGNMVRLLRFNFTPTTEADR